MSNSIALSIISPNCHLPTKIVDCPSGWKVIDLKRHLSQVYPGNPEIEEQRLIFSGQLIGDDTLLGSLFEKNPVSRTVHLVLDPEATKKATYRVRGCTSQGRPFDDDEVAKLKKEYLTYVEEYYQKYPRPNIVEQKYWNSGCSEYISQMQINSLASSSVSPLPQRQNDFPEPNVEPDVNHPNIYQRIGRFFNNRGNNADENADRAANMEGQEGGFDFVEFAYTVFRISLMVTFCVAYSSWQKIILVGFVAALFYLHNEGRRNRQRVEHLQFPRLLPVQVQPRIVPQADPPSPPSSSEISVHSNNGRHESTEPSIKTDDEIVSNSIQEVAPPEVVSPTPVIQPINVIRFIALTSLRFLYALVTSLVPELPVQIE